MTLIDANLKECKVVGRFKIPEGSTPSHEATSGALGIGIPYRKKLLRCGDVFHVVTFVCRYA